MLFRFSLAAVAVLAGSVAHAAEQNAPGVNFLSGVSPRFQSLVATHAGSSSATPSAAESLVTRAGYVVLNASGVISSTSPPAASRKLYCGFVVYPSVGYTFIYRQTTVLATVSGNSFSCSTKVAYKWLVYPSSSLIAVGGVLATDTSLSAAEAAQIGYVDAGAQISDFPVTSPFPKWGETTTLSKTGLIF